MNLYLLRLAYLFAVSLMGIPLALGDDEIPKAYDANRYELIWKKTPFSLPSASPESVAGFAENLALAGVVKIKGEYFAAILDKTTQKRQLISSKPNEQGIKLSRMEASDDLAQVSVVLQKDGESSTLRYDMTYLQANSAKLAASQPPTQMPNQPMSRNTGGPPPTAGTLRRRYIPATPRPQASPNNPQNPASSPAVSTAPAAPSSP